MSIGKGRVIKAPVLAATSADPIAFAPTTPIVIGRRVPREIVDASVRACAIIAEAESRAEALVSAAARAAGDVRLRAEAEGRADGVAQLAAHAVKLSAHEARADERALDRTVELARILAERLLGESLRLDAQTIVPLARQALREARGARRVRIVAHPNDATALERELVSLGAGFEAVEVVPDPSRAPGNLRIETEIGVLDAALAPQLDRLAKRLRESMTTSGEAGHERE